MSATEPTKATLANTDPVEAARVTARIRDRIARDEPLGSFAPPVGSRWVDCHHDVWTMRADGLMETPETRPFPPAHVEKKWGPLLPATRPQELAP